MAPEARRCRQWDATDLALIRAGERVCARRQAAQVTTLGFQFAAHETESVRVAIQAPAERASSVPS